jgi:hypothetical protein
VGVGGASPENQKNGTTLLKIAQLKIYAKCRLEQVVCRVLQELQSMCRRIVSPVSRKSGQNWMLFSGWQWPLIDTVMHQLIYQ